MSQIAKINLNGSYLVVKPNSTVKVLSGQPGEVYFAGRTDELAAILVEAMRTHEFIRIVVHYANEEYELRYGKQREELEGAGVNQLPLFAF